MSGAEEASSSAPDFYLMRLSFAYMKASITLQFGKENLLNRIYISMFQLLVYPFLF
jgi:hypothetical protein